MDLDKILLDIENSDLSSEYKDKKSPSIELPDEIDDKTSEIREDETETTEVQEEKRLQVEVDKSFNTEHQKIDKKEFPPSENNKRNPVPPYVLNVSPDKVERDIDKLNKSYFFTGKTLSDSELKEEIKRALLVFLRKHVSLISTGYDEFIFRTIIKTCGKVLDYFNFDDQSGKLLLYHTGVLNISKILINQFKLNKTGFCFFQDDNGNTVRFLPIEYINNMVLKWFNENISILSLPFGSIAEFERIKYVVLKKYFYDKKIFKTRLDVVNSKIDPHKKVSAEALIKMKGDEWYGNENLFVYQRFTGKNLFIL